MEKEIHFMRNVFHHNFDQSTTQCDPVTMHEIDTYADRSHKNQYCEFIAETTNECPIKHETLMFCFRISSCHLCTVTTHHKNKFYFVHFSLVVYNESTAKMPGLRTTRKTAKCASTKQKKGEKNSSCSDESTSATQTTKKTERKTRNKRIKSPLQIQSNKGMIDITFAKI